MHRLQEALQHQRRGKDWGAGPATEAPARSREGTRPAACLLERFRFLLPSVTPLGLAYLPGTVSWGAGGSPVLPHGMTPARPVSAEARATWQQSQHVCLVAAEADGAALLPGSGAQRTSRRPLLLGIAQLPNAP